MSAFPEAIQGESKPCSEIAGPKPAPAGEPTPTEQTGPDETLYLAKAGGRNRVLLFGGEAAKEQALAA